jgi:hypothetical protein
MKYGTLVLILSMQACAAPVVSPTFEAKVQSTGLVDLSGWARVHGEMMLYPSKEANLAHDLYPRCISGNLGRSAKNSLRMYDGKWVRISGILYDYEYLPTDEENPLFKYKLLDGVTIPNYCLGKKVIFLRSVRIITQPGLR